jgi:hypothetical protein
MSGDRQSSVTKGTHVHTEYDLAQTLHRDRLRDAEEYRRWRTLREEQKRRKAEARAAHRNDSRAQAPALRVRSA